MVINAAFVESLNSHFANYNKSAYIFADSSQKKEDFVKALNAEMVQIAGRKPLRADPLHPLTAEKFSHMLAGRIGPTAEILKAMPLVFKMYGDHRESFNELGSTAVVEEQARRRAARLATPEGQVEARAQAIAEEAQSQLLAEKQTSQTRIEQNRNDWRKNNPEGMASSPSFQEMLEESHAKGEDFKAFLFERVMPTWGNMSQVKWCNHLRALNESKGSEGKATITDTVLSSWRIGRTKPLRESVDVFCRAFDIKPESGELMAKHEVMLWKGINGHAFTWGDKKGVEALQTAIDECKKSGETGDLVTELIAASGIRFERLHEALNIQQLPQWKNGAKVEDVNKALQFLKLVNSQATEDIAEPNASRTISRQNRELLSLITGREFDIQKIMQHARTQGNPGGALFVGLTGRSGLVTITPQEMVEHFKANKLECTDERIKKMRTSTQLQRGGRISEDYALAIIGLVESRMQPLIRLGVCLPFTEEQKEHCVQICTGIPHPRKMLQAAVKGKLPIGELVGNTCERLDLNHMGPGSFCEQAGISHMSDFTLGKANLELETAEKMAAWFAEHYKFDEQEQKQFIALARGVNLQRTPDDPR